MKHLFILSTCLLFLSACGKTIIDAPAVLNESPEKVVEMLGQPDSTYYKHILGGEAMAHYFLRYNIEIQYLNDKAVYIIVNGPHRLPFSEKALKAFKVTPIGEPEQFEENKLIRWLKMEYPVEAVSFFNPQLDSLGDVKNFTVMIKGKVKGGE